MPEQRDGHATLLRLSEAFGLDSLRLRAKEEQINATVAKIETETEMLICNDNNPWPKNVVAAHTALPF